MRYYKEIRFCRTCKARFVLEQKKPSSYYCVDCREKYAILKKKEEVEELKVEAELKKEEESKKSSK